MFAAQVNLGFRDQKIGNDDGGQSFHRDRRHRPILSSGRVASFGTASQVTAMISAP